MMKSRYEIVPDKSERYEIVNDEEEKPSDNSLGGELSRTGSALKNYLMSLPGRGINAIQRGVTAAPSEVGGVISEIPGTRNFKRIGAGIADIGSGILNAAAAMGNVDPTAAHARVENQAPQQNFNPGITKAFGLEEEKPGDTLLRGVVANAPAIIPGVEALKGAGSIASSATKIAATKGELTAAEEAAKLAEEAHAAAKAAEAETKAESKVSIGKQSPEDIQRAVNLKEAALSENNKKISEIWQRMENVTPAEIGGATAAREEAEHHLNAAHEMVRASNLAADSADKNIQNYLQPTAAHDVEAARKIDAVHTANKKEISKGYDALESSFENKNIKVNNEESIKTKSSELMDLIKSNEARTPEAKKVIQELDDLKSGNSGNAKDYLVAYRAVSQYAREARQKAYQRGMNAEERAEWQAKTEELDNKVDEMGKTLEESVGGEEYQKLKDLNSRWRNEVVPLEQNQIYRRLHKYKQMPANIANAIRGDERGNVLLQKIIQSNPDISKNIVGQQAKNVLSPNANLQPYMEKLPELNRMLDYRNKVNESADNAKATLERAEVNHRLAAESEKNELEASGKNQKEKLALRDEMGKHYDTIKKIQSELPQLKAYLDKTNAARTRTGQTLKEFTESQKRYKEAEQNYKNAQGRIKKMVLLTMAIAKRTGQFGLYASGTEYLGKKLLDVFKE